MRPVVLSLSTMFSIIHDMIHMGERFVYVTDPGIVRDIFPSPELDVYMPNVYISLLYLFSKFICLSISQKVTLSGILLYNIKYHK